MKTKYRIISKFYDLIDVFYFNNKRANPRIKILECIPQKEIDVLEICVGTGTNSILIAENRKEAKVTGIDISDEMLEITLSKSKKKNLKNINIIKMDATKQEFKENSFDVVLISLVLHEVTEDIRKKIIFEAKRVLRKEGKILILEWDYPKEFFKKLMFWTIKIIEPQYFEEFLKLNWKDYLEKYNLTIENEYRADYSKIFEIRNIE